MRSLLLLLACAAVAALLWPRRRAGLRDHETCVPHGHVETNMRRWERDQAASLRRAARLGWGYPLDDREEALPPTDPRLVALTYYWRTPAGIQPVVQVVPRKPAA